MFNPLGDSNRNGGLRAATLVLFSASLAACDSDILDVDVDLAPQSYSADFGASSGSVPVLACDPATAGTCLEGQSFGGTTTGGPVAGVEVEAACDAGSQHCFAQARARLAQEVNVLQDDAFVTKVERRAVSAVRRVDLGYDVPLNTLTFDVPQVDVYVGPAGSVTETDPGVVMVGSLAAITAGTTFVAVSDRRHLVLEDGSAARALIEERIQAKQAFAFVLVAAPRMEAGAPMPGGAFTINFYTRLSLGLR
jgi:hypothetical protein